MEYGEFSSLFVFVSFVFVCAYLHSVSSGHDFTGNSFSF